MTGGDENVDWVRWLAESTESLLACGGDARNVVCAQTGLNPYGCAFAPRPDAIAFGSCTSSSPSALAFAAAERAREELHEAVQRGRLAGVAEHMLREIRAELRRQLAIEDVDDLGIVITPSGTDAEYVALAARTAGHRSGICNVVIGPREVGGGTLPAAAGLYFSETTPYGRTRAVGTPIDEALAGRLRVEVVELRGESGALRDPDELDAETEAIVHRACGRGEYVLLHAVAHSKTGVHAPTPAALSRVLARWGERVLVVVDAAQGRVSRRGLRDVLERGALVLFTGSKFYGGPAFAGSVLVPDAARRRPPTLPAGLRDFLSAECLPQQWAGLGSALSTVPNVGLLLRWRASLAEMQAYYDSPAAARLEVMRAYEREVPRVFGAAASLDLDPVPGHGGDDDALRVLESKTTVFSFGVRTRHGRPVSLDEMWRLHGQLNRDMGHELGPGASTEDRAMAARTFHLGQPVWVGATGPGGRALLRLALGGSLIRRVAVDPELGATFDSRLGWLRAQIEGVAGKLELLSRLSPLGP